MREVRFFWGLCLVIALFLGSGEAAAGQLAERLAIPQWNKPVVQVAKGDLAYPDWMAGTWNVNKVESTTAYHYLPQSHFVIEADQGTAVYLSPQDPDYFAATSRPVALYRYRLEFSPVDVVPQTKQLAISTNSSSSAF
ncbi:hypothetical protein BWI75_12325 [Gloeocapsopsis sp. AAB1 = 1H9]|uniref:DUF6816 domain-containing protein n=1 Tax=Gloeocapsopsis dulcis AAB1 = 1H9 TaxID=1433147 RepID=A0A6N8FYA4_9CHRO|nr:hypothetical protein [Gloeocapsopsis dulcis AAB1 = 1H9]